MRWLFEWRKPDRKPLLLRKTIESHSTEDECGFVVPLVWVV
jgi:hypothetical protein